MASTPRLGAFGWNVPGNTQEAIMGPIAESCVVKG